MNPRDGGQPTGLAGDEPVFVQRTGPQLQRLNSEAELPQEWWPWDDTLTEDDVVAGKRELEELSSRDPLEFQISDTQLRERVVAYFEHSDARSLLEELAELAPTAEVAALAKLVVFLGQHEPTAELLSDFLTPELLGQIRRRDEPHRDGGR